MQRILLCVFSLWSLEYRIVVARLHPALADSVSPWLTVWPYDVLQHADGEDSISKCCTNQAS